MPLMSTYMADAGLSDIMHILHAAWGPAGQAPTSPHESTHSTQNTI